VAVKIAISDSSNAHHSVPMLGTSLWHPPLMSSTYHSAVMITTWLQHSPLGSSTHHLAPALTTQLQCSPLGSPFYVPPAPTTQLWQHLQIKPYLNLGSGSEPLSSSTYHLAPALITWLQCSPYASSINHSTPATLANQAIFIFGEWQ